MRGAIEVDVAFVLFFQLCIYIYIYTYMFIQIIAATGLVALTLHRLSHGLAGGVRSTV